MKACLMMNYHAEAAKSQMFKTSGVKSFPNGSDIKMTCRISMHIRSCTTVQLFVCLYIIHVHIIL